MWGEGGRLDDTGGQFQSPQVPRYWDGVSPEPAQAGLCQAGGSRARAVPTVTHSACAELSPDTALSGHVTPARL